MNEINFYIKKQEDGWYHASTKKSLKKGRITTEAKEFDGLRQKIKEVTTFFLKDLTSEDLEELDLPKTPKIRLLYSELLFNNPQAEKILIAGSSESRGYRAKTSRLLELNLHDSNLDTLRKQLVKTIKEKGHHDKHVELRLEELLHLQHNTSQENNPSYVA